MGSNFAMTEALTVQRYFVAHFPAVYDDGRIIIFTGKAIPSSHQEALIAGLEYRWLEQHTRSFLWRSDSDNASGSGFSGSVLCLVKTLAQPEHKHCASRMVRHGSLRHKPNLPRGKESAWLHLL